MSEGLQKDKCTLHKKEQWKKDLPSKSYEPNNTTSERKVIPTQ
jgi:hypothetical protein